MGHPVEPSSWFLLKVHQEKTTSSSSSRVGRTWNIKNAYYSSSISWMASAMVLLVSSSFLEVFFGGESQKKNCAFFLSSSFFFAFAAHCSGGGAPKSAKSAAAGLPKRTVLVHAGAHNKAQEDHVKTHRIHRKWFLYLYMNGWFLW